MAKINKSKKSKTVSDKPKQDPIDLRTPEEKLDSDAKKVYERLLPMTLRNITLDDEIIDVFCRLAAKGRPVSTICDYLAIPQVVMSEWNARARIYEREGEPKQHAICYKLIKSAMRAQASFLGQTFDDHKFYPAGEWQKFSWILERRDRKNWGKDTLEDGFDSTSQQNNDKFL